MKFESKNPFLKNKAFSKTSLMSSDEAAHQGVVIDLDNTMTVSGTMSKTFVLLLLLIASSSITWWMAYNGMNPMGLMIAGIILGLVCVLIGSFKPQYSAYAAPGYAVFEGLFIGAVSAIFDSMYPGIVIQAVGATFVTFMVCLALYRFQIVKVTEQFKSIVIAATLAIATFYIISFIARLIFPGFTPIHHGNSMMSIGISVFVIIIAAMNLFLDFDFIEKGAEKQLPKYMEWFGAMGLMVTLVWLYIEFLRLLSKLQSRN